ncbi:MAG: hypothetical protein IID14_06965 [Candidatus Marinimicrobia bacterium]|nr:hypothetical protein [Candidatus Neomarinimicrobiota bacterium]
MKYTVYIFKCLHTGNHTMGITTNFRDCLEKFLGAGCRSSLTNLELFHVEQHDDLQVAHRRIQAIRSRWRYHTKSSTFLNIDPLVTPSTEAGSSSLH